MPYNQKQTAILVFANSSLEELKHKPIKAGKELFDYFNSQTLKEVRKTRLPFRIYSEREQYGNNFGERFTNAIEDLFSEGYQKIITIGNDSPNLKAFHILEASFHLNNDMTVIGPSTDGGTYLLGFNKNSFDKNSFLELPWQNNQLSKRLITLITTRPNSRIKILKRLRDVDNLTDLKQFLSEVRSVSKALLSIVIVIFALPLEQFTFLSNFKSLLRLNNPYNKGSPRLT